MSGRFKQKQFVNLKCQQSDFIIYSVPDENPTVGATFINFFIILGLSLLFLMMRNLSKNKRQHFIRYSKVLRRPQKFEAGTPNFLLSFSENLNFKQSKHLKLYSFDRLVGTFSHYQHERVFLQIAKVMSSNPWIGLGMLRFECSFATFSFRVAH